MAASKYEQRFQLGALLRRSSEKNKEVFLSNYHHIDNAHVVELFEANANGNPYRDKHYMKKKTELLEALNENILLAKRYKKQFMSIIKKAKTHLRDETFRQKLERSKGLWYKAQRALNLSGGINEERYSVRWVQDPISETQYKTLYKDSASNPAQDDEALNQLKTDTAAEVLYVEGTQVSSDSGEPLPAHTDGPYYQPVRVENSLAASHPAFW